MKDEEFCIGPGRDGDACGEPTFRGPYCQAHVKQTQRTGKMTQIAEKISLEEQFINAADILARADDDEEWEAAKKSILALGKRLGNKGLNTDLEQLRGEVEMLRTRAPVGFTPARREKIRQAMARARANGKHVGRPPKVDDALLSRIFANTRSVASTARALGISYSTAYERLHRKGSAFPITPDRPRKAG